MWKHKMSREEMVADMLENNEARAVTAERIGYDRGLMAARDAGPRSVGQSSEWADACEAWVDAIDYLIDHQSEREVSLDFE